MELQLTPNDTEWNEIFILTQKYKNDSFLTPRSDSTSPSICNSDNDPLKIENANDATTNITLKNNIEQALIKKTILQTENLKEALNPHQTKLYGPIWDKLERRLKGAQKSLILQKTESTLLSKELTIAKKKKEEQLQQMNKIIEKGTELKNDWMQLTNTINGLISTPDTQQTEQLTVQQLHKEENTLQICSNNPNITNDLSQYIDEGLRNSISNYLKQTTKINKPENLSSKPATITRRNKKHTKNIPTNGTINYN